jgi:DNA-binding XRE family transcriptional regulator
MTDEILDLEGVIDDHTVEVQAEAYRNPDFKFRADHFFIDHWLPLLGPSRAWLVIGLQQACWTGSKPGKSTQVSQGKLAQQCGLSRQRVNELLQDDLVARFIVDKKPNTKLGKRQPNSYQVRLTSPLTPAQAGGLQREIAVRLDDGETLPEVMMSLIDEAATARKNLLTRIALPNTPASFPPHTITDIVQGFAEKGVVNGKLKKQVAALAGLLLQPEARRVEEQYLRQDWLPLLSPAGAWLIMSVRRDCYADGEETRNDFSVSKAELAGRLGASIDTLGRLVKNEYLPEFFQAVDGSPWQPGRYRLSGRVRMDGNPLTPADKQTMMDRTQPEPPKGDTVNGQKATPLEVDAQKGDTVKPQKATRLEVDAQKGDTVKPQKTTR